MSQSGRIAIGIVLAWGACNLSGCGAEARREAGDAGGAEPAKAAAGAVEPFDEKVLADHGLVCRWSKQANEGSFQNAYFLPEGIFAVARPKADSPDYRLIRYNLDDGLPLWIYPIGETLQHPPVTYRYPSNPDGSSADEVFILQKDTLICLTLRDGAELWRTPLPFPVSCQPVVDERLCYIGSLDKRIYAVPKKKQYPLWPFITGGEVRSPGVIGPDGQIYFTSTDKSVYRLEETGYVPGRSWSFATGGRILGSPVFFVRWVLVGSTDYKLYCFEVDGTRNWEFPVESPIYASPVAMSLRADKGIVFCISQEERRGMEKSIAWAVDAKTGEGLWQKDNIDKVISLGRKAAFLLSEAGKGPRRIIAVDPLKGAEISSLPVEGWDIIPTNDADHNANSKLRGMIFLISKTGVMQALAERA